MLKYEFDSDKKELFLSFWKIKKVEDFEKIVDKKEFFLHFCNLNRQGLLAISEILTKQVAHKIIEIKDNTLIFNPLEVTKNIDPKYPPIDEEVLDLLDSLNIIDWLKDRTFLFEKKNTFDFSPTFKRFLTNLHIHIENNPNLKSDSSQLLNSLPKVTFKEKITPQEKKILEDIFTRYTWSPVEILPQLNHTDILLQLEEKNFIQFSLNFQTNNIQPTISLHSSVLRFYKNPPPTSFPNDATQSVFYIDLKIYEHITGKSTKILYPFQSEKRKIKLDGIVSLIIKEDYKKYTELDFFKKVVYFIKKIDHVYLSQATNTPKENFSESFSEGEGFSPYQLLTILNQLKVHAGATYELSFLANRHLYLQQKKLISSNLLVKVLKELAELGIVKLQEDQWIFHPEIVEQFSPSVVEDSLDDSANQVTSNTPEDLTDSKSQEKTTVTKDQPLKTLDVDSDMSIIGEKNTLPIAMMYHLSFFMKLEISDYLVKGEFDPQRSSIAWFFGYDIERIKNYIFTYAKIISEKDLVDFLNFYFENNYELIAEDTIKLSTPSKAYFYKLKYLIEKLNLVEQITIIEEKKIFLFHKKKDYETLKRNIDLETINFIPSINQ